MPFSVLPPDPAFVAAVRAGGPDAYGPDDGTRPDGEGGPCRNCLRHVAAGRDCLILATRPFRTLQPHAETGPVLPSTDPCTTSAGAGLPPGPQSAPACKLRGCSEAERIVRGTGGIVART